MNTVNADGPRKAIFITGAASGMGREGAKLFAQRGWYVGAVDVNEQGLATLAQELGTERVWTHRLDVTRKEDVESVLAAFVAAAGNRLDLMWNNAGIGESGWFEDVPFDAAMRVVNINFIGVLHGAWAALPHLKKTPGSLMFSTSSSSATYGMPRIAVYAATKFAVKGLTEALSIEWARHGVRVADTLPGLIDTPILTETKNHSADAPPNSRENLLANAPKKGPFRLMPPDSVGKAVWDAYHDTKGRIHWYVPKQIGWLDRLKGIISPEFVRKRIMKSSPVMRREN